MYLKSSLLVFIVGFVCLSCQEHSSSKLVAQPLRIIESEAFELPVYDFEHFQPLLKVQEEGVIRIVNFWATWCKPCVKELPAFEKLYAKYKDKKIEIILVSLDFPDQVESRLIPFIEKKDFKMPVIFLDDPYTNEWIPKVSPEWSGAIPATVIITTDSYTFYERSFNSETLESAILNVKDSF